MSQISLQEMLDAAVHFGHKTQRWNPKMKPYLYGSRNGIHIFDLNKSKVALENMVEFVKRISANGKTILFVSTKPQAAHLIREAAEATKMPFVIHKWMGGLLTNFGTIKQRIRYFKKLREEEKTGGFDKYTKKEASVLKKVIIKLEAALGGVKDMESLPDVVFVADVVRDKIVVTEARKLGLTVIAITDSNADPDGIEYPLPGNDDAVKSLTYLISAVKDAILDGKKSR